MLLILQICLQLPEYNGWLRKKNETVAISKYRCKDISVGNMGEQALQGHMKGQKYKGRPPKNSITLHFQPAPSSKTETVVPLTSTQTTVKEVLIKDDDAELRWVLKFIESKYSQRSCKGTCKLFPDSQIAQNLKLGQKLWILYQPWYCTTQ